MPTSEPGREEMIAHLTDAGRRAAELLRAAGAHEPDWGPLEKVMPLKWCPGFMFMGYEGRIRLYKHGFTRHYLNVDPDGNCYRFDPTTETLFKITRREAIDVVFEGLTKMGVSRSTPYDEKARRAKHKALAEAGWTTVAIDISQGNEPMVIPRIGGDPAQP